MNKKAPPRKTLRGGAPRLRLRLFQRMQRPLQQRREGKNPVFRAADIGLKEKTDYWN